MAAVDMVCLFASARTQSGVAGEQIGRLGSGKEPDRARSRMATWSSLDVGLWAD
jgi:hypothetical protein